MILRNFRRQLILQNDTGEISGLTADRVLGMETVYLYSDTEAALRHVSQA